MPVVRINIPRHWPEARIAALADIVPGAPVETMDLPVHGRVQVITPHRPQRLTPDRSYLAVDRGPGTLMEAVA